VANQADVIIDSMLADFPAHRPGTRPIHASGIAVTGWFQASPVAAAHSEAEHFSGGRVPVTVRFSNGTGVADEPDATRMVRGMAVRFHLGEVTTNAAGVHSSTEATDLISVTLPVFFTRTIDDFLGLTGSAVPTAAKPRTWWRNLRGTLDGIAGTLRLLPPPKGATPADLAVVAFADRHPPARLGIAANSLLPVPESYATCCYHAVHAFRLTAGDRVTSVRFHWEPVAGVRPAPPGIAGNYLHEELAQRLQRGSADFVLRVQVAEAGDDTTDPTTPWSQARRKVVMGQLNLDAVVADQELGCEALRFDPTRMVPGIDIGDDPILAARREVYGRSADRRSSERAGAATGAATACPVGEPVN